MAASEGGTFFKIKSRPRTLHPTEHRLVVALLPLQQLERSSEQDILKGRQEAHCKYCDCFLRAHHSDLVDHGKSQKHKQNAAAFPAHKSSKQGTLFAHGFQTKPDASKVLDLKLAAHVACHSSVKTVDHLGELLRSVAKGGTAMEDLHLHRTKCGKLISKILAPVMLKEIVADIGDEYYSIIIDASTDVSTVKYMAVMVKYFSYTEGTMVVDLLGLFTLTRATADLVYEGFKAFMNKVGLPLSKMFGLGTDGGLELCGARNSLFAYLKQNECPNLVLIKCICHGLDNCASMAAKKLPSTLEYLLRESRGWFSHSSVRKHEYEQLYKTLTDGEKKPPTLVRLAATRWLAWYGAVKAHSEQYGELKELFTRAARSNENCHMAKTLGDLHEDGCHFLYLVFLRPVLKEVVRMNVAFQKSTGDISAVYKDLKSFIFTIANKILKPEAVRQTQEGGMLRLTELQALQVAMHRRENLKPLELISYGDGFWQTVAKPNIPPEKLKEVQTACAEFLLSLLYELTKKLPSCIEAVEKMRAFTPAVTLAQRGRPQFNQLPLQMIRDPSFNMEDIESQWEKLATLKSSDICPDEDDISKVDIIKFWATVWSLKSAAGDRVFGDLARYVLLLTLPLSNAVVERLFSLLALVTSKIRNKLGVELLEAILRVRTHFHAHGKCCKDFEPSKLMIESFNSEVMYGYTPSNKRPRLADAMEDERLDPDDPLALEIEPAELHLGDDGLDDAVPRPEWDDMFELLREVDEFE